MNLVIIVDSIAVPKLGQVQIDSNTDRDDTWHQKHDTEEEHLPVPMESIEEGNYKWENQEETE